MEIWPVIHLHSLEQSYRNAELVAEHGADGVFLIHMEGDDDQILPTAVFLRKNFPQLKIGGNFLSLSAVNAVRAARQVGLDAVWSDRPGLRSDHTDESVDTLEEEVRRNGPPLFFASVAFKYQPEDPDPPIAALRAWERGFIPTTSGEATGKAPPVEKLMAMHATLRTCAPQPTLALASGAGPDNIGRLAPYLSHVLVSTGISSSFVAFDMEKVRRFMAAARSA